jgi:hypothetical protein
MNSLPFIKPVFVKPVFIKAIAWLIAVLLAMPGAAAADDEARRLAQRSLDAMGGAQAWDAVHFVRFTFAGFRTHYWDKYEGRYRLQGKNRQGDSYVVLMDLDTKQGDAWLNGEKLAGDEAAKQLENAWGAWVNDTYWLIMPYKLFDPGVSLVSEGKETLDGKAYDKVRLTFDGVGLTPGDTYWVYFDPETGLVARWAYVLEGWEEGKEATAWTWGDWKSYGGVLLASERKMVGGDRELPMGDVAVFDSLPDSVFTSPEPVPDAP